MPHYVMLMNWTDQGVKTFRDSVERADAARGALKSAGIDLTDIYWTIGPYDIVAVAEAPDDETLAAAGLALGAQGNLRTTTMRGFTADEFRGIVKNAG